MSWAGLNLWFVFRMLIVTVSFSFIVRKAGFPLRVMAFKIHLLSGRMWSKEIAVVNGTNQNKTENCDGGSNDPASGDIHVPKPFIVLKTGRGHRRGGLGPPFPRRERWGIRVSENERDRDRNSDEAGGGQKLPSGTG